MDEERMIYCAGLDYKQHLCLPESDLTKCGVVVRRKKLLKEDNLLFSSYECTY